MKLKYFINFNKGLTIFVMFAMIAVYDQWENSAAWVYLALHGSYGILWILKSKIYPDSTWEQKVTIWYGIGSWVALALYWLPGWLLISHNIQVSSWYQGLCIVYIYFWGILPLYQ